MQAHNLVHYLRKVNMGSKEHLIDKLTGHYESVKMQHDDLDTYIAEKYKVYANDDEVHDLKKRKLQLKDEMERSLAEINRLKAQLNES